MQFKTDPFPHQLEEYEKSRDLPHWGLFWEMGVGKTKVAIDTAAHMHETGAIDGLIVMAPNGVHSNWTVDELPTHMPDEVAERMRVHTWWSKKARNLGAQEDAAALLRHEGLATLAISYNGMRTPLGHKYLRRFLKDRRCLFVADESHHIKAPGSKRTIRALSLAQYAPFRRILTGTLVEETPFDVYSQLRWLDRECWASRGICGSQEFRDTFGRFRRIEFQDKRGFDRAWDKVLGYRNIPYLRQIVAQYGSRVLKDILGLPPKLHTKRYFELSPAQRRIYKHLREEFFVELEGGEICTAEQAIVRMTRLQQVTSGYLPSDDGVLVPIEPNPRIPLLVDTVQETCGRQSIIWAKYSHDIDLIAAALKREKITFGRYDGRVTDRQCEQAKAAFKAGDVQVFLGNLAKGREGLTLVQAKTVIYYNNLPRRGVRRQSEDRAHRIGQTEPVTVVDLAARGTVDDYFIKLIRSKEKVATQVMGDPLREWI